MLIPIMDTLTHFDADGATRMVDVGDKSETSRTATATALVRTAIATMARIRAGDASKKGNVLEVARLAGIMAAKKTSDLIPLCHPLPITSVAIEFAFLDAQTVQITATTKVFGRTGVEMEALTAVTMAALTVYDMCKAIDRGMTIDRIQLEVKTGGKSGDFQRDASQNGAADERNINAHPHHPDPGVPPL